MILARASWRYHLRQPWQALLAVGGIALGVAVVVAVQLANASAERAFTYSAEALSGQATHEIVGGSGGLSEAIHRQLRRKGLVDHAAAVVEGFATDPEGRAVRIVGVDPWAEGGVRDDVAAMTGEVGFERWLTDPGVALAFDSAAERLQTQAGETVELTYRDRTFTLELAAVADSRDRRQAVGLEDTVMVDIAAAQELLGREGRLTRIDLVAGDEGARRVQAFLDEHAPDAILRGADAGAGALQEMTSAFRLNLTAFSLLSLLVGALLIYNAMAFSVLQRRSLFARLRVVGVARRQLIRGVLMEGALLGLLGAALGLPLGWIVAEFLLEQVTRTVTDLYFLVVVRDVLPEPTRLVLAGLLGVGVSLLAAAVPALEAATVTPRTALHRAALEARARARTRPAAVLGALVVGLGALLLYTPFPGAATGILPELVWSFAGVFLVLAGFALLVPWSVRMLSEGLHAVWAVLDRRTARVVPRMALRGVSSGLSRSSVAATALVIAVTAVIGVSVMIDSFRGSLEGWLDGTLAADWYISLPTEQGEATGALLPPEAMERLRALEGVAGVSGVRYLRLPRDQGEVRLRVFELDPRSREGLRFKERTEGVWERFQAGEGALITEPFAAHEDLSPGDRVRLRTPAGPREVPVKGIVYDYTTSQGAVFVSAAFHRAHWADATPGVHSIRVYQGDAALLADRRQEVEALLRERVEGEADEGTVVRVRSQEDLRRASLEVFDRTFAVTQVLRWLAILVAAAGVFGALLALTLERLRETAILRALGLTPAQVWSLEVGRTALLGGFAGILAWPPGVMLADALTRVINQQAFGWSLALRVDPVFLLHGLGIGLGAAFLAGIYPAWRASRVIPAQALREE